MKKSNLLTHKVKEECRMCFVLSCVSLILLASVCFDLIKYKDYVEVEAEVVDIYSVRGGEDDGTTYYISVQYHYDEVLYSADVPVYESNIYSLVKIKCNPQNPTEIADTHSLNVKMYIAVFIGIMAIILLADIYFKYRKQKEYKNLNSNPLEIDINKGL